MNDYELLGLIDTHKALVKEGVGVPAQFSEFLQGLRTTNTNTDNNTDGTLYPRR